jgi:hypothetical protein
MKTSFTALLFFATIFALRTQPLFIQDTLINETFDDDPTSFMLSEPGGNDHDWVNYDADHLAGLCVEDETTPPAWYWEGDFGFANPQQATNFALTSCSFLESPFEKTANWLITLPIAIPDASYWLCWRSLSYYGPGFLDGYKVLVSTSSNFTGAFTDTLFVAAEMIEDSSPTGSLNPANYVFSAGYVHANGYTDTAYYYVDYSQGPPFLHGKFEPHKVSLADFAGDTIYIAFLHDSQDDFILQIDDIVVTNTTPTHTPPNVVYFNVLPNPVRDAAYLSFKLKTAEEGHLLLTDNTGKVVKSQTFGSRDEGLFYIEMQHLEAGIYYCTLETAAGRTTTKLVKL